MKKPIAILTMVASLVAGIFVAGKMCDTNQADPTPWVITFIAIVVILMASIVVLAGRISISQSDKDTAKFYAVIGIGFTVVCFFAWLFYGHWNGIGNGIFGIGIFITLFVISLAIYFFPSYMALKRNHKNFIAIFALNLLTGWSFVGWVIALVWALKVE